MRSMFKNEVLRLDGWYAFDCQSEIQKIERRKDVTKMRDMEYRLIKNGTIVTSSKRYRANLYIREGKIAAISENELDLPVCDVVDAEGKLVLPGLIDTHVHSRDGKNGAHYKEDFLHSSMSGAVSGITTIYEMPNSNPAVYNVENLNSLVECITPKAYTDFGVWGLCLGDLNRAELRSLADAGVVGFKFFWGYAIDSKTYQLIYNYKEGEEGVIPPLDLGQIYDMFDTVASTGKMVAIHAEDFDIIKRLTERVQKRGDTNYAAMLESRPVISETIVIQEALELAKALGVHVHILHLAAGAGVDLIRDAQAKGIPLTGETCPHYLALTDQDAEKLGAMIKGYPPVRTQADQDKLWEGLRDGTLSFVCSDHAPHSKEEKQKSLWEAPAGMATIETMPMVMLDAVSKGKITMEDLVRVLSEEPAKMFGTYPQKGCIEVGADADLVLVDPEEEYVFHQENLHSRTKLSPFDCRHFKGRVKETILRGQTIAKNGEIVGEPGGRFVKAHQAT